MALTISQKQIDSIVRGKEAFVFDWDGTLFDSMEGKTTSFSTVVSTHFAELSKQIKPELVAAIYRSHSGKPRNEIFLECAKEVKLKIDQASIDEMSARLFVYNRDTLSTSNLFPDALRLLKFLMSRDIEIYISSSVPQSELEYFLRMVLPENILTQIKIVLGSSNGCNKGRGHLSEISASSCIQFENLIVIGDDEADFELSQLAGVNCILIDRIGGRFDARFPNVIKSMDELC
jgi:phosphoglycolate phosphatase-like HAD superfamily hydrolase